MAMSQRRLAAMQAHAARSGPEADIARRKLGMMGTVTSGGGGSNLPVRRMPGAGGPRAIGGGRNLPAVRGGVTTTLPNPTLRTRPGGGGTTTMLPNPRFKPKAPAGAGGGAVDNVVREAGSAAKNARFKGRGKGLAIGLGAAVIGGLAYSGRRGEGSSGGRAGMTRY